jgi:hypothetical protein
MILEHDGVVVDFFERFPQTFKHVGIHLSGGTDSALILYLLVKLAQERNDFIKIFPITGYDVCTPQVVNYNAAENIVAWVKRNTGYNNIEPAIIVPFLNENDTSLGKLMRSSGRYLMQWYKCGVVLDGVSLGMPHLPRPELDHKHIRNLSIECPHEFPWATVNKQFIAAQYRKYNIDELANLTNSCIDRSTVPCKHCWWCQERYWAFGSYDGGIQ